MWRIIFQGWYLGIAENEHEIVFPDKETCLKAAETIYHGARLCFTVKMDISHEYRTVVLFKSVEVEFE